MKKILSLTLAVLLLCLALISCQSGSETSTDTQTVSTLAEEEAPPYDSAIDSLNFDQKEITMMTANATDLERFEFYRESELDDGDAVNLAVYMRNFGVQEKLNVKLSFVGVRGTEIYPEVLKNVESGDSTIDLYALLQGNCLPFATRGGFLDLMKVPYLNTESSWWNQTWNEATEFNNARYTVVGDANTTVMQKTICCFVNTDILKEQYPTDTPELYWIVEDGYWTLEYLQTLVKNVYEDNGSMPGVVDMYDTFGMTLASIGEPAQALLGATDFQWTQKDADGNISMSLTAAKNIDIMEKIHELFKENKKGIYRPSDWPGAYEYANHFAKGKQMLAMAPMFTAEKLVATDVDYIVLPMPKYDSNQQNYYSSTQDSHTFCAIASATDSTEASAAVLEYMGYLSERDLTPKYYDVIYKTRYASNEKTMALFDKIVSNVDFDFAVCWSGSLNKVLISVRTIAADPSKGISSSLTTIENGCKGYLDKLMKELGK